MNYRFLLLLLLTASTGALVHTTQKKEVAKITNPEACRYHGMMIFTDDVKTEDQAQESENISEASFAAIKTVQIPLLLSRAIFANIVRPPYVKTFKEVEDVFLKKWSIYDYSSYILMIPNAWLASKKACAPREVDDLSLVTGLNLDQEKLLHSRMESMYKKPSSFLERLGSVQESILEVFFRESEDDLKNSSFLENFKGYGTPASSKDILNVFVTHKSYEDGQSKNIEPIWTLFAYGHGLTAHSLTGLSLKEFAKLLQIFQQSISTRAFIYISCYATQKEFNNFYSTATRGPIGLEIKSKNRTGMQSSESSEEIEVNAPYGSTSVSYNFPIIAFGLYNAGTRASLKIADLKLLNDLLERTNISLSGLESEIEKLAQTLAFFPSFALLRSANTEWFVPLNKKHVVIITNTQLLTQALNQRNLLFSIPDTAKALITYAPYIPGTIRYTGGEQKSPTSHLLQIYPIWTGGDAGEFGPFFEQVFHINQLELPNISWTSVAPIFSSDYGWSGYKGLFGYLLDMGNPLPPGFSETNTAAIQIHFDSIKGKDFEIRDVFIFVYEEEDNKFLCMRYTNEQGKAEWYLLTRNKKNDQLSAAKYTLWSDMLKQFESQLANDVFGEQIISYIKNDTIPKYKKMYEEELDRYRSLERLPGQRAKMPK